MAVIEGVTRIDMTGRGDPIAATPVSPLEALADRLGRVDRGSIRLKVEARPGFAVEYSLAVDGPQLAGWRRAAEDENMPTGYDEYLWHRVTLAALCKRIFCDGTPLSDRDGKPLTFRSAHLWELLRVPAGSPDGAMAAVRALYGDNDFAVGAAFDRVLAESGFGKAAETADPTPGPSSS